ncbi:MAG: SUMF1/EgtB/PvdO family nonheme iron enzyme [Phycisphaerae bacterium]|jgi:hypothetical protein
MKGLVNGWLCCVVAVLVVAAGAQADVFNMGGIRDANGTWTGLASLETVHVGDPGNVGEFSGKGVDGTGRNNCGAVAYEYNIGKYEVTAGQYAEFLNAVAKTDTYGLYNPWMAVVPTFPWGCNIQRTGSSGSYTYSVPIDRANRPVNNVCYWDACRFTNWLSNGQPTGAQGPGTTETGTYTLNGYDGNDGRSIQRNADAKWAVTSEDEWYKAAYYKGGSTNAGYWDYRTSCREADGDARWATAGHDAMGARWHVPRKVY